MAGRALTIALVIPAWDEAEAIAAVLGEVPPYCVPRERILVIVGGETDPTAAVVRAHGARALVQLARGYGAACWTGAQTALAEGADVIAFLDGDYADPPGELARVLAPILNGQAELVLGCRDLTTFPDALPLHARLGNQLVLLLLRGLLGTGLRDLPSYKAIRADSLRRLGMCEMTYGWTVEMLVKARRSGLRIAEVDVGYRPRLGGRSKVAGSLAGSTRAAAKLLGCAVAYSTRRQWAPASGQ